MIEGFENILQRIGISVTNLLGVSATQGSVNAALKSRLMIVASVQGRVLGDGNGIKMKWIQKSLALLEFVRRCLKIISKAAQSGDFIPGIQTLHIIDVMSEVQG